MGIKTQRIEIQEKDNPLNSRYIDVPVHKGEKILQNAPYVMEAMKLYSRSCSDEVMKAIATYEATNSFRDVCEGYVSSISNDDSKAHIYLTEKHDVPVNVNPIEKLNVGDKIDVVVTKSKGVFSGDASSKCAQIERLRQELVKEIQSPTSAYVGLVKEIVYNSAKVFNGFIVDIRGVKCFMPGTESDVVPLNDFNALLGKELLVMPVNIIKESIIVSHKEYLSTLKPSVIDRLGSLERGTVVNGCISSIKPFGVFILIDECVATLLSASEMDEITESKFKSGDLKVGDSIDFYIDGINNERITVTQTVSKAEGWDRLKETVTANPGYVLKGSVKNIFENGIVILSEEFGGITFFLSAKVVDITRLEVGQIVELPVENVDTVKKTVRMKID